MGLEIDVYTASNFDETTKEIDLKEKLDWYGRFGALFKILPYFEFEKCYNRKDIEKARKCNWWKYASDEYELAYPKGSRYFLADLEILKNLKVQILDVLHDNNNLKKYFPESEEKDIEYLGKILIYINEWMEYMENDEQIVLRIG